MDILEANRIKIVPTAKSKGLYVISFHSNYTQVAIWKPELCCRDAFCTEAGIKSYPAVGLGVRLLRETHLVLSPVANMWYTPCKILTGSPVSL